MQSTNVHDELYALAARYTEGLASNDDVRRLNALLETSGVARGLFLRYCNLDSALAMEAAAASVGLGGSPSPPRRPWLAGRSTAAAVLAAVCGAALGASVAWAVVPQSRDAVRWPVLRCDFEHAAEITPRSAGRSHAPAVPGLVGSWQADIARVTEAEHGVSPYSGSRMVVFEQALAPAVLGSESPRSCDLYQIIDLSSLAGDIAAGTSSLSVSAWFLDASRERDVTSFELRIHFFSQPPEQVTDFTRSRAAVATNVLRTFGNDSERGWRRLVAGATVPSDAVFAVLQISAARPKDSVQSGPAVFGRHYCDEVELTFTPAAMPER